MRKRQVVNHSPGVCLGTNPIGETIKLGSGLELKGPATRPASISVLILDFISSGFNAIDFKFFESRCVRGPEYCTGKP